MTTFFAPHPRPPQGGYGGAMDSRPDNFGNDDGGGDGMQCFCKESCVVLTCRTGDNEGRQFYKCPKERDDPSNCGLFKWADEEDGPQCKPGQLLGSLLPVPGCIARQCLVPHAADDNAPNKVTSAPPPHALPPAGKCGVSAKKATANSANNAGRVFFCCSRPREDQENCQFFEWVRTPVFHFPFAVLDCARSATPVPATIIGSDRMRRTNIGDYPHAPPRPAQCQLPITTSPAPHDGLQTGVCRLRITLLSVSPAVCV